MTPQTAFGEWFKLLSPSRDGDAVSTSDALYQHYRRWCSEGGHPPLGQNEWSHNLTKLGFPARVARIRAIYPYGTS